MRPVALAIRNENMQSDRIFELPPDGPVDQAPYTPWGRVRQLARDRGFRLFTADRADVDPRETLLIAYDWIPRAQALVAAGARPAILTTLEPPVIAWSFYY